MENHSTVSAYAIPGLKGVKNMQITSNSEDKVSYIEGIVCEYFGENLKLLKEKSRVRNKVLTRFVIMHLLRKYTTLSLLMIGSRLNRDHASVTYGCQALKNLMETDEVIRHMVEQLDVRVQ